MPKKKVNYIKKIPKNVTILGRKFSVRFMAPEKIGKLSGADNPEGAMNFKERRILISNKLGPEDAFVTYLHECHHCISYICGHSQVTNWDRFEMEAESFANGFFDVFKNLL